MNHDPRQPSDINDGLLTVLAFIIAIVFFGAIIFGVEHGRASREANPQNHTQRRQDDSGTMLPGYMAPPGSLSVPGTGMSIVGF